jgi:hypothetical protein
VIDVKRQQLYLINLKRLGQIAPTMAIHRIGADYRPEDALPRPKGGWDPGNIVLVPQLSEIEIGKFLM